MHLGVECLFGCAIANPMKAYVLRGGAVLYLTLILLLHTNSTTFANSNYCNSCIFFLVYTNTTTEHFALNQGILRDPSKCKNPLHSKPYLLFIYLFIYLLYFFVGDSPRSPCVFRCSPPAPHAMMSPLYWNGTRLNLVNNKGLFGNVWDHQSWYVT